MSYYCLFEYKGIVKPKYRRDIETVVLERVNINIYKSV